MSAALQCIAHLTPASPLMSRTYDEYSSELISGHLSWTPVHDSELFWKENATKLNDKDYAQLKWVLIMSPSTHPTHRSLQFYRTLIKLLKESHDPTVLAVAAHDVGQYVKHYERGKKSVQVPFLPV